MNYSYPYFGFPNYAKHFSSSAMPPYYYMPKYKPNYNMSQNAHVIHDKNSYSKKDYANPSNNQLIVKPNLNNNDSHYEKPIFSILGINLYFDDVLLICMIFFLYSEKIEDTYLLLALVLLLLS